jgi:putative FmdB family regulatory protein
MPTYQYKCKKCEHTFEKQQHWNDQDPECPKCKSKVKKVYSVPSIAFKGSGFYVNDK